MKTSKGQSSDCIVIGGGIIGMLSALELHRSGARVLLIERGELGREASWAGGGILAPMRPWDYPESISMLARWSQEQYCHLAKCLLESTGIDPELRRCGLIINGTDQAIDAVHWARKFDYKLTTVTAVAIRELAPVADPAVFRKALWLEEILQVRNSRLLKGLKELLQTSGVQIRRNIPARRIICRNGAVAGVVTDGGTIPGAMVLIACGAWTERLLGTHRGAIRIRPIRGQIVLFRGLKGAPPPIMVHGPHYLIPRLDGRVLAGSTLEDVGFRNRPTMTATRNLRRAAVNMVPDLATCEVETVWAGLRPATADRRPYIGAIPGVDGLYVNAGHFRNGLLLAPASARLIREIILGQSPGMDPRPFAPDRDIVP